MASKLVKRFKQGAQVNP